MKVPRSFLKNIPPVVSLLFILLFVYAGMSKLLDFETFQAQLEQFLFFGGFVAWVSHGVILLELLIAGLLCFGKTRLLGFYLSFFLILLFTAYILTIINLAANVPCSCGGVLDALGWKEHLIFNVFFIGQDLIGILIERNRKHDFNYKNTT
ncbi:MauE/DoxX family redox-associated membrane protein [Gelidibacter salicanalis]|uniref:Methylamine utilisation protein MauE domain-containing protein n=1 Tax=Gelidibacter salicanalis TaxID=291193 RepID=A0A934KX76_9FLAO|nr:MauE/DoxX family redox-associated membrane protein [Gelidibacter salicanalis]MBJ7880975.1 hypothetical protein [Gelidibacter salicanalis]